MHLIHAQSDYNCFELSMRYLTVNGLWLTLQLHFKSMARCNAITVSERQRNAAEHTHELRKVKF